MAATTRWTALVLLLALAACKPASSTTEAGTSPPPAPSTPASGPAATGAACPDPDFASFLKRFERSADAQRTATADPLTMDSIDSEAIPEPKRITKQVALADLDFPLLLASAQRQAEGLQETVVELAPTEREVTHGIPESDAQVRFLFRAAPCWTLVRVSSDAI